VTVLFFEKEYEFFQGQGVPLLCSPRGRVDSEKTESILPGCYENKALNTVVFFIDEIVKQFIESRGFKGKSDVAVQCSRRW
jgi:hypothetical protein